MPEVGGFEVLASLDKEEIPHVIFVTAYDQYAVRAFEVQALDYLLKPFDQERFDVSWQRAKTQILRDRNGAGHMDQRILALLEEMKAGKSYLERLVIKAAGRIYFLETGEIDWIEAEGNYVSVHSAKKSHLLRETISSLESQLDPEEVCAHPSLFDSSPGFHSGAAAMVSRRISRRSSRTALNSPSRATTAISCRKPWANFRRIVSIRVADAAVPASSPLVTGDCPSVTKATRHAKFTGITGPC